MNEWLLIVTLLGRTDPAIAMTHLPNQQACIDAGDAAKKLWPPMQVLARYSCTEIKQQFPGQRR